MYGFFYRQLLDLSRNFRIYRNGTRYRLNDDDLGRKATHNQYVRRSYQPDLRRALQHLARGAAECSPYLHQPFPYCEIFRRQKEN